MNGTHTSSVLSLRRANGLILAATAMAAVACSDSSGPSGRHSNQIPALLLSAPVSPVSSRRSGSPSIAASGSLVVYVSLPPGAVPDGVSASIRDRSSHDSLVTPVVDGGFDPVAIAASVGDEIDVVISRGSSARPLSGAAVVAAVSAPHVVRTDPPKGKADVPLNASIVVVFSEPVDGATIDAATFALDVAGQQVSGVSRLSDSIGLRAEFDADTLLQKMTTYTIVVSRGVRDLNGTPLDSAISSTFTTGNVVPVSGLVFTSLATGSTHACGLIAGGAAYCWGDNQQGELGDGTLAGSPTPVAVTGGHQWELITAGDRVTCGVDVNGDGYCWGLTSIGAGGGPQATPLLIGGGLKWSTLSLHDWHACGLTTSGAAYCWGWDNVGEGGGDSASYAAAGCLVTSLSLYPHYCGAPVAVVGGLTFSSLHSLAAATCAVTPSGAAYCWGANDLGSLGAGVTTGPASCSYFDDLTFGYDTIPCSPVPVPVVGGYAFADAPSGAETACGLTTGGVPLCWGDTTALGGSSGATLSTCYGHTICSPAPVVVGGGAYAFTALSASGVHACGLTATGAAYCWGWNFYGQLGDGTTSYRATPVAVIGGHSFASVSASAAALTPFTCALTSDGVAWCWGFGYAGQLGNGGSSSSSVPVKVKGQP